MPQQNIKQVKGDTQGSVLFLGTNGVVSENNGQLYWDSVNNRLGIGTASPTARLDVRGQSISGNGNGLVTNNDSPFYAVRVNTGNPNYYTGWQYVFEVGGGIWGVGMNYPNNEYQFLTNGASTAKFVFGHGDPSSPSSRFIMNLDGGYFGSNVNPSATIHGKGIDSTSNNFTAKFDNDSNGALLYVRNDGNIGVGTASPTAKLHINATQSGTGFRLVDTTEGVGKVLTSDANGVATWATASGGSVTSTNGLTYSGSIIKLGGVLTEHTLITNGNRSFTMSTTNNIEFYKNLGGVTYSNLLNNTGASVRAITNTGLNLLNVDDASARIEVKDTVSGSSFSNIKIFNYDQSTDDALADSSTNNRMVVQDDYYRKGLIYKGDYSLNFTNNSLVTKAYVDSVSGGGFTGSGVSNYVPYWITPTQLSPGVIYDSGTAIGIATQSNGAYAMNVLGDVNITGTLYATSKSFEIVHPLDNTKRLTYGSLEGPEYGVYYRGKLNNEHIISLPDYWTELVDENSITVNLTPFGIRQNLYVEKVENNKVYVGSDNSGLASCYYVVYAERKDIPKIIVEK